MAKQEGQKLKLLYLLEYLSENTDEAHGVEMSQIREALQQRMNLPTPPDRKSVYDDLKNLNAFLDPRYEEAIQTDRGKTETHYKLIQHEFQIAELKMIIDTIASSKFLSEAKSRELIKKLERFCSSYQRRELNRHVAVIGRAKSMNNSVLYSVNQINAALANDSMISFKYFHYNLKLEREYHRKGGRYLVSPWALIYDNNQYYLLAYENRSFIHYRVDKMADVSQESTKREGYEAFKEINMSDYTKSTFGMYTGVKKSVTMIFQNWMLGTVIDRFGKQVWLSKVDDKHFKITVPVAVSPQFFSWIFGLGNYVTITDPPEVVAEMKQMLTKVSKRYE